MSPQSHTSRNQGERAVQLKHSVPFLWEADGSKNRAESSEGRATEYDPRPSVVIEELGAFPADFKTVLVQ